MKFKDLELGRIFILKKEEEFPTPYIKVRGTKDCNCVELEWGQAIRLEDTTEVTIADDLERIVENFSLGMEV